MWCVSQGFVGYKRVSHQCWYMSSECPSLAEACLSCLILQMGFWNSWVDADALTRDCLTLLVSLQTLSQLLGVFYVFIFLAKQFELIQAIPFPPPPTLVKTPPFWLQSSESFITQWVLQIYFSIFLWWMFSLFHFLYKGDMWLGSGWETHLCPPGHSIAGYWGKMGHLLGLKAVSCGRCFGSAQGWRCLK